MTRRRLALPAALLSAALVGAVVTTAVRGGGRVPAAPPPPPVTTATVVRTDLATTTLTGGTLGYGPTNPVVNRLAGTFTQLPAVGTPIAPGQVLYQVDNEPVVLMTGDTPAWRPFVPGMTAGPDVSELQSDLIALGDASGLFSTASGAFDGLTIDAVERWQSAGGYPATGQVALGEVVFLPSTVLVGAGTVALGQTASPGAIPFEVTTTTRAVTVPLNPNLPTVTVGEPVSIVLPTNATTPGKITAIGPAPPTASSSAGNAPSSGGVSNSNTGSGSGSSTTVSTIATVSPDRPIDTGTGLGIAVQVALTTQSVTGVLAVPVSALLALAGGGYGLEIVASTGAHHLVGVTTGVFAGSRVQVSGSGIEPGTRVVVTQ